MSDAPEDTAVPLRRRAAIAAALMVAIAGAGQLMVPTRKLAEQRGHFRLSEMVPSRFGRWQPDPYASGGVVNPQSTTLLNSIYSQILERSYVDDQGHRVMLSIAYSDDQTSAATQVHFPEVCYPAQGFQVHENVRDAIVLPMGTLQVRRLQTSFGKNRYEPLTYWTMAGEQQSLGGWDRKLAELRHGLRGEIIDGLVFRVSTIDTDTAAAFRLQDEFLAELLAAASPQARRALAGL